MTMTLDELSRADAADPELVLSHMRLRPMHTIWEVTANQTIARTVQRLDDSGRITIKRHGFPWHEVVAIDGERL